MIDLSTLRKSFEDYVRIYKPKGDQEAQIKAYCKKYKLSDTYAEMLKIALDLRG